MDPYSHYEGTPKSDKPPVYSYDQGPAQSTHVVMTQPSTNVYKGQPIPSSYLWLSMVACCFCWPMAICALYLSHESAYAAGAMDYPTAKTKGKKAMRISIGAILLGLILLAISIGVHVARIQAAEFKLHDDHYLRYHE